MSTRTAKADVRPARQRTQYTCMSTSLMMCLQALGHEVNEDEVNKVMGARPMKGAQWEHALAAAQHYGCRSTLVVPSTVAQLKEWTDAGNPVMIAWNPEGRDWSHASVVFDVDDEDNVYVADPNCPDPDDTVRVVPKKEFYQKWFEKWPDYLVRRPAMMITREVTPEGRQVMAGWKDPINLPSLDSLKLRSLGKDTHPKVLEQRVQDMAAYLAKGMSPKRAVRQWFKDNGDRLPEDYPKSPRGTDIQLKSLAESLHRQLMGIAAGLSKSASTKVDNHQDMGLVSVSDYEEILKRR